VRETPLLILLGLFDSYEEGIITFRNVGNHSSSETVSHLRRPEPSAKPLWEPEILNKVEIYDVNQIGVSRLIFVLWRKEHDLLQKKQTEFYVDRRNSSCVCTVEEAEGQGRGTGQRERAPLRGAMCTIWQHWWYLRCTLYKLNGLPPVTAFPFSRVLRLLFVTYFWAAIWVGKYIGVNNTWTPNTTTIKNNRRHSNRCVSTPDAQTDHGTSCLTGIEGYIPGVKRPGREADHLLSCCAEVKN
jgi:hypothetical protein